MANEHDVFKALLNDEHLAGFTASLRRSALSREGDLVTIDYEILVGTRGATVKQLAALTGFAQDWGSRATPTRTAS